MSGCHSYCSDTQKLKINYCFICVIQQLFSEFDANFHHALQTDEHQTSGTAAKHHELYSQRHEKRCCDSTTIAKQIIDSIRRFYSLLFENG